MNEFILITAINDIAKRLEDYLELRESRITDTYCQNQIKHINEVYAMLTKEK